MKVLKFFLMTVIFLNTMLAGVFASEEGTSNSVAVVKIGGSYTYNIEPGEATDLTIPITNPSSVMVQGLNISAKADDNAPFSISFLGGSNFTDNIQRGGSVNLFTRIDVDKNAPSGKYPITLNYTYTSTNKDNLTGSDTFYVKIENGSTVPVVVLNNFKTDKESIKAGENFSISLNAENTTNIQANNISVEVLGLAENNINILGSSNISYIPKLTAKQSQNISFNFGTTTLTKQGSNKMTFKVKYNDYDGKEYVKDYDFYINVSQTGGNANSDIEISSLISPTGTFGVAKSGVFKLKIKNTSSVEAENIKVSTKLPEGIVPTSANTIIVDKLAPNTEKVLTFSVAPTSSATTQTYSIGFLVEYDSGIKSTEGIPEKISMEQYGGFNVNNPTPIKEDEETKTSVPKIIISKYQSSPMVVEAGKPFDLAMTFQNTSNEKAVENIKVYLTVADQTEEQGNVFAPNNSSLTYFIDKIPPKGETSHTFNLFAVPDAKPRSYTVNVNFEYEDSSANEYKSTELVGVNVKQNSGIEISQINAPEFAYVGESTNISFQVYNTGKTKLSNFLIKLEGEGLDTSEASTFIGNFESGSQEYYDVSFIPTEVGAKTAKILISYQDTSGEEILVEREISLNVEENFVPTGPTEPIVEEKRISPFLIIVPIIIIIIVIVIIIIKKMKKAKAKKELDFDEQI